MVSIVSETKKIPALHMECSPDVLDYYTLNQDCKTDKARCVLLFRLENYDENSKEEILTYPFLDYYGNPLSLSIYPSGNGKGENTHLSLFLQNESKQEAKIKYRLGVVHGDCTKSPYTIPFENIDSNSNKGRQKFLSKQEVKKYVADDKSLLISVEIINSPCYNIKTPSSDPTSLKDIFANDHQFETQSFLGKVTLKFKKKGDTSNEKFKMDIIPNFGGKDMPCTLYRTDYWLMNEKDKPIFGGLEDLGSEDSCSEEEIDTWWSITSEEEQELKNATRLKLQPHNFAFLGLVDNNITDIDKLEDKRLKLVDKYTIALLKSMYDAKKNELRMYESYIKANSQLIKIDDLHRKQNFEISSAHKKNINKIVDKIKPSKVHHDKCNEVVHSVCNFLKVTIKDKGNEFSSVDRTPRGGSSAKGTDLWSSEDSWSSDIDLVLMINTDSTPCTSKNKFGWVKNHAKALQKRFSTYYDSKLIDKIEVTKHAIKFNHKLSETVNEEASWVHFDLLISPSLTEGELLDKLKKDNAKDKIPWLTKAFSPMQTKAINQLPDEAKSAIRFLKFWKAQKLVEKDVKPPSYLFECLVHKVWDGTIPFQCFSCSHTRGRHEITIGRCTAVRTCSMSSDETIGQSIIIGFISLQTIGHVTRAFSRANGRIVDSIPSTGSGHFQFVLTTLVDQVNLQCQSLTIECNGHGCCNIYRGQIYIVSNATIPCVDATSTKPTNGSGRVQHRYIGSQCRTNGCAGLTSKSTKSIERLCWLVRDGKRFGVVGRAN
eukprot:g12267.t1